MLIVGKQGAGKTTLANQLVSIGYKEYTFAYWLKEIINKAEVDQQSAAEMFYKISPYKNVSPLISKLWELAKIPKSPHNRAKLQFFGQAVRDLYPDFWVKVLEKQIAHERMNKYSIDAKANRDIVANCAYRGESYVKANRYVISDCRYRNEFDAFKKYNLTVYLDISDETRKKRLIKRDGGFNENSFNHPSETEIDSFKKECDLIITEENLDKDISTLLSCLGEGYTERETALYFK